MDKGVHFYPYSYSRDSNETNKKSGSRYGVNKNLVTAKNMGTMLFSTRKQIDAWKCIFATESLECILQ